MQLYDLSQTIHADMQRFSPDAPAPSIRAWQTHEQAAASGHYEDCTCEITEINILTSIGTYLDSPYHYYPDGTTIDQLKLEQLVLPGIVIDCTSVTQRQPITPDMLGNAHIKDKAVLFHTGWSRYWGQSEYLQFPYLTGETAQELVHQGAKLAGVDFLVIDDTTNPRRPVHSTLLNHDVLIVENLTNLASLPEAEFTFHAVPTKIAGAAAFPIRAYAIET